MAKLPMSEELSNQIGMLTDALNEKVRDNEKARLLVNVLMDNKKYDVTKNFVPTGLVYYPEELNILLSNFYIDKDVYASMICRCLEYRSDEKDTDWHSKSFDTLEKYYERQCKIWEIPLNNIFLMHGRRDINKELYEKSKALGIRDIYYENDIKGQKVPYNIKFDVESEYIGYRKAYHWIKYGGDRRNELLCLCETNGYDCTYDAICEYFNLDPLESESWNKIKNIIN